MDPSVVGPNEQVVMQVRRHPISLFPVLVSAVILLFAVIVGYYLIGRYQTEISQVVRPATLGVGLEVLLIVISLMVLLSVYVYSQSRLILTTENLIQVKQIGIFNRKVSVLNLKHIEDVTGHVNGVFATLLGYGEIVVETAGEQENFTFSPVANPYPLVEIINRTHQEFEQAADAQ